MRSKKGSAAAPGCHYPPRKPCRPECAGWRWDGDAVRHCKPCGHHPDDAEARAHVRGCNACIRLLVRYVREHLVASGLPGCPEDIAVRAMGAYPDG